MKRFLMCSYGAAAIAQDAPTQAELLDTVAVSREERYRVWKAGEELFAVRVEWNPSPFSSYPAP